MTKRLTADCGSRLHAMAIGAALASLAGAGCREVLMEDAGGGTFVDRALRGMVRKGDSEGRVKPEFLTNMPRGARAVEGGSTILGRLPKHVRIGGEMPEPGAAGGAASLTDALTLGKVEGQSLPTPATVSSVPKGPDFGAPERPRPASLEEARARALSDLASSIAQYRYEGAMAAGMLRIEEAVPLLARLARGSDSSAVPAIGALGVIGGEEAARALAGALSRQRETHLRVQLIRALGVTRARNASRPLLHALATDLALVKIEAARALGNLGDAAAVPRLRATLVEEGTAITVKVVVASALARLGDTGGLEVLERAVSSRSPELGAAAVGGLAAIAALAGRQGDDAAARVRTRAVQSITVALGSRYEPIWGAALRALARLGPAEAVPVLDALENASPEVRLRARIARAAFGGAGSREVLEQALTHQAFGIRSAASEILGLLGDRASVEGLSRALDDPHGSVRLAAAWALGRLGDPAAVPALERAGAGKDAALKIACARALHAIGARGGAGETRASPDTDPGAAAGHELQRVVVGAEGKRFCLVREPGGKLVLLGRGETTSEGYRVERIVADERGGGTVFLAKGREALTLRAPPASATDPGDPKKEGPPPPTESPRKADRP